MSKKKQPWVVEYWDDFKDCLVRSGYPTYEQAMTAVYRVRKKLGREARIEHR